MSTEPVEFAIHVPERVLVDLRGRLLATRWGGDFGEDDWSLGANGAYLQSLVRYWIEEYDWRARERLLNALPQYHVHIGGTPIHFVHVRGQGPAPLPIILSHGWPWTFWDFQKLIGPLADPVAYGGDAADAFHVVVPSLPGYAFSMPATRPFAFWHIADLWAELMTTLGYERFAAHGGDWGSFISAQLGHKYAARLAGVHIQLLMPLDVFGGGSVDPALFLPAELPKLDRNRKFYANEFGYALLQKTKPRTHAFSANDSPAGLLAWIVEKRQTWSGGGDVERYFSKNDLIDTAMIYWITESFGTAARLYHESAASPWRPSHARHPVVEAPTACVIFPDEVIHQPRRWAERYYNLKRWTEMPSGGHFGAMQEPAALIEDIRTFIRPLR
jgi:pimeloyl-ACP methyl ester carboxylesterase